MGLAIVTNLWRDEGYRWNTKFRYKPEHVNRLFAALKRTMTVPFKMVLFADPEFGHIDPRIHRFPMWTDLAEYGGCWRRVRLFDPAIEADIDADIALALDLDVVVTGDLSPLLRDLPLFKAWRNASPQNYLCGSMFAWHLGKNNDIWDDFNANDLYYDYKNRRPGSKPDTYARHRLAYEAGQQIGSEQTWLAYKRNGCPLWGRADGVYSFKKHLASINRLKRGRTQADLPAEARIVHFHGPHDPSIYTHLPWVRQHWLGEFNVASR